MSLWSFVCSVHLCKSVRNRMHPQWEKGRLRLAGEFFLSQSPQSLQSIFAHVLSPQKAFGIQRTQSVSAIVDTNKGQHEAFVLLIGVSRWSRPSLRGRGRGRGQLGKGEGPAGEGGGATISLRALPVRWKASVHLWKSVRNRIPNRFPAFLKKPDKNVQESSYGYKVVWLKN